MKHLLSIATLVIVGCAATAAAAASQTTHGIRHELTSGLLQGSRTITVHTPPSYDEAGSVRYPVLYLLDGDTNLGHASAVTDFLGENGIMPEVLLVGIHAGATRAEDYLPPGPDQGAPSGNADAFLSFIEEELIPFVEAEYRSGPFRMISGHSYGGVFVTYAAAARPELFRAYLTQSPFLNEAIGTPLVDRLAETIDDGRAEGRYYFANVGDEPALEENVRRVGDLLTDGGGSFDGTTVTEPGATHMATRMVGLHDGLGEYFREIWPFDDARLAEDGADGLEAHLSQLEGRFGFPVLYSAVHFQRGVQLLLSMQRPAEAVRVGGLYTEQYPGAVVAHFLLGNARAAGGDREGAVESIRQAMELYDADPTEALEPLRQNMTILLDRLGGEPE